eukprot:s4394_g5.t1
MLPKLVDLREKDLVPTKVPVQFLVWQQIFVLGFSGTSRSWVLYNDRQQRTQNCNISVPLNPFLAPDCCSKSKSSSVQSQRLPRGSDSTCCLVE